MSDAATFNLNVRIPPPIKQGDTVGIFSPSSASGGIYAQRFQKGLDKLRSLGFRVVLSKHALSNIDGKAGLPQHRADDFMDLFVDQTVRAIIATIGGDDSQGVLPYIDWDTIAVHPKWFVGYSDTTAIQCALLTEAGIASIYGPTLMTDFAEMPTMPELTEHSFLAAIAGTFDPVAPTKFIYGDGPDWASDGGQEAIRPRVKAAPSNVVYSGKVCGRLVGGCIESLVDLVGTQWFPVQQGDLLLLETSADCFNRSLFRYQLSELGRYGAWNDVQGVIFGAKCWSYDAYEAIASDLRDFLGERMVPSVVGLPIGHVTPSCSVPIGLKSVLDVKKMNHTTLRVAR